MSNEKTEFQERFLIGGGLHEAYDIRKAIVECFPFDGREHKGLSRLVLMSKPHSADSYLNLIDLIPEIRDVEFPEKKVNNFFYQIVEGTPGIAMPKANTFFVPTKNGYVCMRMDIDTNTYLNECDYNDFLRQAKELGL